MPSTAHQELIATLDFLAAFAKTPPPREEQYCSDWPGYVQVYARRNRPMMLWWHFLDVFDLTDAPRWLHWSRSLSAGWWPLTDRPTRDDLRPLLFCFPYGDVHRRYAVLADAGQDDFARPRMAFVFENEVSIDNQAEKDSHRNMLSLLQPEHQRLFSCADEMGIPWYDLWLAPETTPNPTSSLPEHLC